SADFNSSTTRTPSPCSPHTMTCPSQSWVSMASITLSRLPIFNRRSQEYDPCPRRAPRVAKGVASCLSVDEEAPGESQTRGHPGGLGSDLPGRIAALSRDPDPGA